MSETRPPTTTTDSGIPAQSDEYSLTVGPSGPTALHDHYVVQKMQHFNRERVPERVVHAKGSGAHGFFEVTDDVTWFTRASFLSAVGKRTPMFARFSTVAGEQGYADTVRDPRGFALKFYTDEGNFDMVGNNTPVFFVRDASKFSRLHPLPEAPARHRAARQQHAVGLLDPVTRERPPSDHPHVGPGNATDVPAHERLQQPHLLHHQRRRGAILGQVPLQDGARGREPSPTARPRP